ncbi:MAG: hypothetical protein ACOCZB_00160 [Spirochaetota bacterium]
MSVAILIAFLTYLVAGAVPPLAAHYLLRIRFLGGAVASALVGVIGAVLGGLAQTMFLSSIPDLVVIAGTVDIVPPVVGSILITVVFALVSSSNST